MIPEVDRYHGVVFRQLLVLHGRTLRLGAANLSGRVDAFVVEGAAIQIKYSSKRLSPWRFTFLPEHLAELTDLRTAFDPVWSILICGQDGVVGLSFEELATIVPTGVEAAAWVRISRDRNSMYRVGGASGDLPYAKARGLESFLAEVLRKESKGAPVER